MNDRHTLGEATRRQVLGDAHVDRSKARATPLDAPFQALITEAAWGHVWSSDALTRRERSMITLALLAGLGNWDEFELHLRATINTGASAEDVAQVLQHVAIYAGVPRANTAMKLAKTILAEREETR
jgi:4-carboxymuconolactone decarboxylase